MIKQHWSKHKKECGKEGTHPSLVDCHVLFPESSICIEDEELEDEKDIEKEILEKATIWDGADGKSIH